MRRFAVAVLAMASLVAASAGLASAQGGTKATLTVSGGTVDRADDGLFRLRLSGRWTLDARPSIVADVFEHALTTAETRVAVETDPQLEWDSGLLLFMRTVLAEAERRQMTVDLAGLPGGARRLLALASATPEYKEPHPEGAAPSLLTRIGSRTIAATRSGADVLA